MVKQPVVSLVHFSLLLSLSAAFTVRSIPIQRTKLSIRTSKGKDHLEPPPPPADLRLQVKQSRNVRAVGVLSGASLFSTAAMLGIGLGIVNPIFLGVMLGFIAAVFFLVTESFNEYESPCSDDLFVYKESTIPNAGMGLFTKSFLKGGTYLMDYEGEVLTEDQYFDRYPDGTGRYVAEIPGLLSIAEPTYIDASDASQSNLARYMNSQPSDTEGANVFWKKQRFGKRGMKFYTSRDVAPGEELCFDYGDGYWDVVAQTEEMFN